MADAKTETEQEPSIEEILESIREIISEEDEEETLVADTTAETDGQETSADKGADLDLTPKDDDSFDSDLDLSQQDESVSDAQDDDILDLTEELPAENDLDVDAVLDADNDVDIGLEETQAEAEAKAEQEATAKAAAPMENNSKSLLSEHTKDAALASLVKLSGNMPVERERPQPMAGITLEDITRELMQPILKEWLDENLPDLIERIVQKEIRKITKNID